MNISKNMSKYGIPTLAQNIFVLKTLARIYISPNRHLPECIFVQIDTCPKGYLPEWTLAQMDTCPNVYLLERTFSRMDNLPK